MLSAHGIVNQNVSRVPGMQNMLGSSELPETGAFDFFNYLLGLQVNSADLSQGQEALLSGLGKEGENADLKDPIQTLFQKKEQPLWNPMIPGGQGPLNTAPVNVVKIAGEVNNKGTEVLSQDSSKSKTTQDSQLLENRLLEPKLFIETREKALDVNSNFNSEISDKSEGKDQNTSISSDKSMSKGVEKYTELSRLETQAAKPKQVDTIETVKDVGTQSRISTESNEVTMSETKSTEKKRGKDLESQMVLLNNEVKHTGISEGGQIKQEKVQVMDKSTLPEVFKKVESMIHHGGGKMTVELSPPELGKLEVDVVTKGNQVEIKMRSDNDVAKVTLESHMGELKNAMEGQNLTLHKVEVHVGLDNQFSGQSMAFSQKQGNSFQGENNGQNQAQRSFNKNSVYPIRTEGSTRLTPLTSSVHRVGGVDIRI